MKDNEITEAEYYEILDFLNQLSEKARMRELVNRDNMYRLRKARKEVMCTDSLIYLVRQQINKTQS